MSAILVPGRTCARVFGGAAGGLLVDGRDYYRALHRALCQARRSILIAAWQIDGRVALLRGDDAAGATAPVELLPLLEALCEERPGLEVHVLAWDYSALFALEREPLVELRFNAAHERIHFRRDAVHPVGASHHWKLVVVDEAVAFMGGMDVCASRWDDRRHARDDDRRRNPVTGAYDPYHDVQAYVTGEAVGVCAEWFAERWARAAGTPLALPPDRPRAPVAVAPTIALAAPRLGLARTRPPLAPPTVPAPVPPVEELRALHVAAIAAARRIVYIENQYFSSDDVTEALRARLARPADPPLEIVLVLPDRIKALKERLSLGRRQARLLTELVQAAAATGHHMGVYYTVDGAADQDDLGVYVHAKVVAVDDRFLLCSSANTTNRSMGLDTELGVAWEDARENASIRAARVSLLAEHCGLDPAQAERALAPIPDLVARLDAIAADPRTRLRRHDLTADEGLLARVLPEDLAFDPDGPVLDAALWELAEGGDHEPLGGRLAAAWRLVRDALVRR
jgi:phosphatidylserine/phosphatidylglycerophosphate/cardiolipin synthase-like enzyme